MGMEQEKEKPSDLHTAWKLHSAYFTDNDGHPILKESLHYNNFTFRENKGHNIAIPGRAVTVWTILTGVTLHTFHPPTECLWLAGTYELKKLPNWYSFIEGGHTLYLGTSRKVEELLENHNR